MSEASDYDLDDDDPRPTRCRVCGSRDVWWNDTSAGWRLYEGAKPHVCPLDDGAFPVVKD